jgi:2-polyprenyl-6-methoxyphenol hydroxylase-like FAD-dependent oxidoreductase
VNRGDSLLPAVTAHLSRWGVLDRFLAAGARPVTKMQVCDDAGGGLLFEAPLPAGRQAPYLVLPHPRIEQTLLEAATAGGHVEVRYSCRAETLIEENGRVHGVRLTDASGTHDVRAALVVGADGTSSMVRAALDIPLPAESYEHGFFIVDVDRPDGYEDAMRIELCADGGVLVVPQDGDRVGLGVLVHDRDEKLFRSGAVQDKLESIGRRTRLLAGRRAYPGSHLYKVWRGHAPRYIARGAALLGDAVHVTNPTAGQGMTMSIEDAASLARHLAPALASGENGAGLDASLEAYERERHPRNEASIRWSHWMSCFYAWGGPVGHAVRKRTFAIGATPFGQAVQRRVWTSMATRSPDA